MLFDSLVRLEKEKTMGSLNKFFGKKANSQELKAANNLSFIILRDAVTFKADATNWIRAQNTPPGTLMWFVLPCEKNQCYQPCFGVLADPALFGKLDRAKSFDIALGPTASPSTFQWKIIVADPDKPGNSFSLVTVPLLIDETSLAKLQFLSEQVRVHYLFYASLESSNFVYLEMHSEFNDHLRAVYHSLKNKPTEAGGGSDRSLAKNPQTGTLLLAGPSIGFLAMNPQIGTLLLGDTSIKFADGTIIPLADIKEISAPENIIGHPDHPLVKAIKSELKEGHGYVYLVYITKDGPLTTIIPTVDHSAAVALAERIKDAKAAANKQTSDRVIVGECTRCHRKLRVKAHAVKTEMVLTCKCGQQNRVRVTDGQRPD
jgi:hypothetical protein